MSDCLVLLAHGSKDPRWCVPFEKIVNAGEGPPVLLSHWLDEPSGLSLSIVASPQGHFRFT